LDLRCPSFESWERWNLDVLQVQYLPDKTSELRDFIPARFFELPDNAFCKTRTKMSKTPKELLACSDEFAQPEGQRYLAHRANLVSEDGTDEGDVNDGKFFLNPWRSFLKEVWEMSETESYIAAQLRLQKHQGNKSEAPSLKAATKASVGSSIELSPGLTSAIAETSYSEGSFAEDDHHMAVTNETGEVESEETENRPMSSGTAYPFLTTSTESAPQKTYIFENDVRSLQNAFVYAITGNLSSSGDPSILLPWVRNRNMYLEYRRFIPVLSLLNFRHDELSFECTLADDGTTNRDRVRAVIDGTFILKTDLPSSPKNNSRRLLMWDKQRIAIALAVCRSYLSCLIVG
jgi:hypothetical protein